MARLAAVVAALERPHPVRVAVDGPDAAGKTTLADELAREIRALGRPVVRASADDFQRPRADRHGRGALSPEGYLEDAFDHAALRRELLEPLGPGGGRRYRTRVFDLDADSPASGEPEEAVRDAVLILDGVFLLCRDLRGSFDFRIFVSVAPRETLRRALVRDVGRIGSRAEVERRYRVRYLPAQRLYNEADRPEEAADVVLENDDPARPVCLRRA